MMDMDKALRRIQENELYHKIIECVSEGSEGEVRQKVQSYLAGIQKLSWVNKEQLEHLEGGVRRAAEAKRRGRGTKRKQTAEKEQSEETRAQRTDEQEAMSGLEEVRTGRGSAGLVRGREDRCQTDETGGKSERQRQRRQRRPWKQRRNRKQRNASGHEYDEG